MVHIRDEVPADAGAREALLDRAFGPARFAKTCQKLRDGRLPAEGLSLAAEEDGRVVGTIRFWHVALGETPALMLGPVAVEADARCGGIGAGLIREGLARAKALGHEAVMLVGDAPYYERFGFAGEATEALAMPGPVERERFLALELQAGALEGVCGAVRATGAVVFAPRERVTTPSREAPARAA